MEDRRPQSGQAMVLVVFAMLALIGSAALVLLAGSVESQRNQIQQVADEAALDAALKIGTGCTAASASAVITEADNFVATQRTRTGALAVAAGTCATPYTGTDTFAGGLTETIHYPYRAHQQQVEVILSVSLPLSFGGELGNTTTTVARRAVAQQLSASVPAISATTLSCTAGQVNVAGSVNAQNLITRGGTCAVYAHQRFDAASGTYSDLGNVSVYADGQTWTAPGTCVALANSGSSSAICADGYELSGHATPACAGATTSFLSVAGAAVNPNPCAAGVAPQPVSPVANARPPDPNTDPSAVATLPGGAACAAGTVYPNLVVAGTTVGTAEVGTTAPAKDAAGYYHFKPSCYGYLDLASMKGGLGGISNRQVGTETPVTTHFITPTLPGASIAGTLLVATINSLDTPTKFTAPASWVAGPQVSQSGGGRSEIWYYPNNPGGISSATFTVNPANINVVAQLTEWSGVATVAALDQSGTDTDVASPSETVSTAAATAQAGDLVITANGFGKGVGGQTYAPGAGWTSLMPPDTANGFASEYRLDLGAAVASETVTGAPATPWALTIAAFKPAAAPGASGAVLDPGFYYFNGSGFAGGGGICLNGSQLLGRDVTLEFVNQAGFSSGTCAAGGGAACAGASCELGSTPCSISACPPNAGADSPNNLTWFAAPCSSAPPGDVASCPGSAWCTAGDRGCSNLLIWAPAANTGQIAIAGAAVKHWLLGSIYWPGACTDSVNGTSTIAGSLSCGTLSISAAAGTGIAVGSDYGIGTALVEAVLVE
jgi:hypothetical protein